MMKGEGQAPWFQGINAVGKIPVLRDGDLTLTESAPSFTTSPRNFPQSGLLPSDLRTRAKSIAGRSTR